MHFDQFSIRFLQNEDLFEYFNLIDSNRKRLEDFFAGTVAETKNMDDTREHLNKCLHLFQTKKYFPFLVIDTELNKLVSSIQLKNLDWSIPKAELGYFIDAAYEKQGIVCKAVSLILDFAFVELNLRKVFLRTNERNIPSIRIAENNGFELEGKIRSDYITTAGEIVDVLYYGKINPSLV